MGYYIHIGVGFEVAYLSELGKFDGLKSEISNEYGSHAFLYLVAANLNNNKFFLLEVVGIGEGLEAFLPH